MSIIPPRPEDAQFQIHFVTATGELKDSGMRAANHGEALCKVASLVTLLGIDRSDIRILDRRVQPGYYSMLIGGQR